MCLFRRQHLFSKLAIINGLAIGIVILFAGLSIKDYACLLVNDWKIVGPEFNKRLDIYFLQVSLLAFLLAFFVHFFLVKRVIHPLKKLTDQAIKIKQGVYPVPLQVIEKDEIGELTKTFNEMTATLQDNEQKRTRMFRDIAHELRTPLTNLNGYLEGLKSGVIHGDTELFGSLLEESKRLTRLVEQVTELNRWEDSLQDKWQCIAINQLIMESVEFFSVALNRKRITYEIDAENVILEGNKDGLKQILFNLLNNVCFYDKAGWVKINGEVKNSFYKISIINEGQYINPEKKDLLFDRFYRGDPSRKRNTDGSGLGLTIVKEITEAHGGHAGIETDGKHHCFWFQIPIKTEGGH
ncbi:sensor histidine kinase [Fictibacillus aquaticus]|uniref:histidine kinase n=1 Tax=Fictibacillus aquaticus TaxID=2021314 RepID=A0A235F6I3_9BACL|nr:HAMP domain-containing sensor histidine kinase [Fictibacillus aquaticus]OYD56911.1 hypothetical protein CGZ90_15275 [Fictibacillus aquaticus]